MSLRTPNDWITIEGAEVQDLSHEYGVLGNIPANERHVYYNHPEITFKNPYSSTHSIVYSAQPISFVFGYTKINEINNNWNHFIQNINTWINSNNIDVNESHSSYYDSSKPFTIDESCVIFYDDSNKASITGSKYGYYTIVLVDKKVSPPVKALSARYNGNAVPVGEEIDLRKLVVNAIYEDGNQVKVASDAYDVDNDNTAALYDKVVTINGVNVFKVYFSDVDNTVVSATFTVMGTRNLESIRGEWNGGKRTYKREAEKRYFKIIAHYTDGSESTVTDYTFPNNNIVTEHNGGLIDIYYKGKTCQVQVPIYAIQTSRLVCYYNGPQVEVNKEFLDKYLTIKIIYGALVNGTTNSYSKEVGINDCTINSHLITKVGENTFTLSYNGDLGEVKTSFVVMGFIPDLKPTDLKASYDGPGVYVGNTIDLERILCNVYYNNGEIKQIKNFTINSTIITNIGPNSFMISYTDKGVTVSDFITINGLEQDSTTKNNIYFADLYNYYPNATVRNNRYRGPAEGIKTKDYTDDILNNIKRIYDIYASIESQYNTVIDKFTNDKSIKITTLNNISYGNHELDNILNDKIHYTTGKYVSEDMP